MTVDGGSLLYGLAEDKNKRLTKLSPIELAGASERVAQIAETSISEPPFIRVLALHTDADPAKGYLVVAVPQSARAPHQVISGDEMRYYGRGAKGNRILSESEVATLYARRERWEANREQLLDGELARAPAADPSLGYVVAYARPVVPNDSMVEEVAPGEQAIVELLIGGAKSWGDVRADPREGGATGPDLRAATTVWRRGAEGWALSTGHGAGPTGRDAPRRSNSTSTARVTSSADGSPIQSPAASSSSSTPSSPGTSPRSSPRWEGSTRRPVTWVT